jgi:hypothetical protein
MEAVKMLKRALCVLSLVGLMACAASAQAPFEFVYDTGHPNGPMYLDPGMNDIAIGIVNNSGAGDYIGGLVFEFSNPDGLLSWTLPDNWAWGGPMGDPIGPDGQPAPPFPVLGGGWKDYRPILGIEQPYFATSNPVQTALLLSDGLAVPLPAAGDPVMVGTLSVMASLPPGPAQEVMTEMIFGAGPGQLALGAGSGFIEPPLGGTNSAMFTIVPEPATLGLLGIGGLMFLRRRR